MVIQHFTDDHPAAPTFTPPELPKRVHVRGATGNQFCDNSFFVSCLIASHFPFFGERESFFH